MAEYTEEDSSEECAPGEDGPTKCGIGGKKKTRAQRVMERRAYASSLAKRPKKVFDKIKKKLKLKPGMDEDNRPYEEPTVEESHRNVRFL